MGFTGLSMTKPFDDEPTFSCAEPLFSYHESSDNCPSFTLPFQGNSNTFDSRQPAEKILPQQRVRLADRQAPELHCARLIRDR
jgi:hypothetical protein